MAEPRKLIVYLTRSCHTRRIAELLRDQTGADLFEVKPVHPYPEDDDEHAAQARHERDTGFEPLLAEDIDIAAYDDIYLGFPIWADIAPPPIRTFLKAHDWTGKTLHPFISHGGDGEGESLHMMPTYAPGAAIGEALVVDGEEETVSPEEVEAWVGR